jgi:hypothetical protein
MEAVLLAGDLSKLSPDERTRYLMQTCQSLGLNPLTKPFDYIRLSGREVLYATKGCADQLRSNRRISLQITDRKVSGDLMIVTVRATTPDGRFDEDVAAVAIKGLQGEALANACMKAITKAKRRVTLSICGLGMLDESEVRSVLEAEALAGPVSPDPRPKPKAIEASPIRPPAQEVPKTATTATFLVKVPYGGEPASYPRTRGGAKEAYREIEKVFAEGHHDIIELNTEILDEIATRVPALAEEISNLRAAAAELTPDPDAEPDGFVAEFVGADDDTFPGDKPSDQAKPGGYLSDT